MIAGGQRTALVLLSCLSAVDSFSVLQVKKEQQGAESKSRSAQLGMATWSNGQAGTHWTSLRAVFTCY
jgi:hypothetical protein